MSIGGSNGAGKSTLLRAMQRDPSVFHVVDFERARAILLDQYFERLVFPYRKVWWNVAVPLLASRRAGRREAMRQAIEELKKIGLEGSADKYPETLSGGETHLMLLSRLALASENVLLLDEPTSGLDRSHRLAFWRRLAKLDSEKPRLVVVVSHDQPEERGRLSELTIGGFEQKPIKLTTWTSGSGS